MEAEISKRVRKKEWISVPFRLKMHDLTVSENCKLICYYVMEV